MREWVGPDAELCFDFHGKMTPALAIEVCHELKGMRPMFVEERCRRKMLTLLS